ncbi:MAG: Crp/Fnr family transcriptional regulator [Anaerolineales bacterium]
MPPKAIYDIVSAGQIQFHKTDSGIFHEGWECAGLYVLLAGRVHLCKTSFQGQALIISVIDPVIMFNEMAAMDGNSNPITAVSDYKCITWWISHERFQSLIEQHSVLGLS